MKPFRSFLFGALEMEYRGIDAAIVPDLCDPDTRNPFELEGHSLRNVVSGRVYPIRDSTPLFVSTLTGSNLKSMSLYNRVAPFYDLATGKTRKITCRAAVEELELEPGMRLLEVAIGTGATIPFIPPEVELFGVDISLGMLRRCRKKLDRRHRNAHLFQAEASRLPFRGEVFDRVLLIGGISRFSEPERALKEMIWVARPGAKAVIIDRVETPRTAKPAPSIAEILVSHLPPAITGVRTTLLGNGQWFCLSFRKQAASAA